MVENNETKKSERVSKRPIIITFIGMVVMILLIIATVQVSQKNIVNFISIQKQYVISIESIILVAFTVEMLVRLTILRAQTPQMIEHGARLRLIVRIVGYSIGALSVISILSSNPTLGISVGAVAGIVIAFATQNIVASILAAIILLSTRMIKVGEEITISQTRGTVSDINLTHTILSVDDEVVFVPNSMVISNLVRRKKRSPDKNVSIW